VLGAGICGLASGMMLARDGHAVTILERDEGHVPECPEQAWELWARAGVGQFRQPHFLQPGGRAVLETELPDVTTALSAAGATTFDALCTMPPTISDREPRDGDERFITVTARRPVFEQVLGATAHAEPGLEIRRGIAVAALTSRTHNRVPHVTGVRTDSGDELTADLVVDAMGRRSALPQLLWEAGAEAVYEEAEDGGFIYYTRFFRSASGALPALRAPLFTSFGTFSIVTLPGDNGTWSVTVFISTGDRPLKRLRDPGRWTAVVAACPLHAHWLDGEPLTGVVPMSGVLDRYRSLIVDGRPVATGVALLADAWACTNPALGRGMTLGLLHARQLRDLVRTHLGDPREFTELWHAATEAKLTPWYRETVRENRARLREFETSRNAVAPEGPGERADPLLIALLAAVPHDPDVFRAFLESRCCIAPLSVTLNREGMVEKILELARDRGRPTVPGPNREQLLQLLN
jgi:2-polyprenyl-6-methoxyphenol hydroxylase-like FAD-dependent oxidoreductase